MRRPGQRDAGLSFRFVPRPEMRNPCAFGVAAFIAEVIAGYDDGCVLLDNPQYLGNDFIARGDLYLAFVLRQRNVALLRLPRLIHMILQRLADHSALLGCVGNRAQRARKLYRPVDFLDRVCPFCHWRGSGRCDPVGAGQSISYAISCPRRILSPGIWPASETRSPA